MRAATIGRIGSARDRRALLAGAIVAAPAFLYAFMVKPYVAGIRRVQSALQEQAALLTREEDAVAGLSAIVAGSLDAVTAARRAATRIYTATDTAIAMTSFGRDVTEALKGAGLVIQRVEMRDSVARHAGLQELTIDLTAQGEFQAILNALARLEGSTRLVHVTRLSIDRAGDRTSTTAESLSLMAVVRGYAK